MPRTSRVSRVAQDPWYEARMKAALDRLSSGQYTSIAEAAREQKVCRDRHLLRTIELTYACGTDSTPNTLQ